MAVILSQPCPAIIRIKWIFITLSVFGQIFIQELSDNLFQILLFVQPLLDEVCDFFIAETFPDAVTTHYDKFVFICQILFLLDFDYKTKM